jgi:outer membrane protein TolC
MMFRTALIVVLASISSVAAQEPVPGSQDAVLRLTLDVAIARGLENSQRLAELQARQEAAAAVEAGQHAAAKPLVALTGGYTRTNHVDEFGISEPGFPPSIIYPDIPDNFRTRLDLQWPVYTGGRTDALERAARAEREATGEDLTAARLDLRLEIARAFWALVTAREAEVVVAQSVQSMDAHVSELRSRLEQGLIPPNDVLSAEAQESRARLLAIEATNARGVADADLHRLLGIEGEGSIEPVAALASAPVSGDSAASLIELARKERPERRALSDRVDAFQARSVAASSGSRPQIGVAGGYDYARPNARIFPRIGEWRDSWDVSVNVSWLLWDVGRRRAEYAEAIAGTRGAQARAADFDRQLTFEVRQRWLEVDSSRAAIATADDGLRSATEARRVVEERFNAGVAVNTDVLDAQLAMLQAGLDRTRALANARLAEARLQRAVGR